MSKMIAKLIRMSGFVFNLLWDAFVSVRISINMLSLGFQWIVMLEMSLIIVGGNISDFGTSTKNCFGGMGWVLWSAARRWRLQLLCLCSHLLFLQLLAEKDGSNSDVTSLSSQLYSTGKTFFQRNGEQLVKIQVLINDFRNTFPVCWKFLGIPWYCSLKFQNFYLKPHLCTEDCSRSFMILRWKIIDIV